MNMPCKTTDSSNCEAYEIAISEMIDGELSSSEKLNLTDHLLKCAACRQTVRDFEVVTSSVFSSVLPGPDRVHGRGGLAPQERSKMRSSVRYFLAVAGTVLAASVLFLVFVPPSTVDAEVLTAEQVFAPVQELHLINLEQEHDHKLALKAMELELRRLRLELAEFADDRDKLRVNFDIELMIDRVIEEQFYAAIDDRN